MIVTAARGRAFDMSYAFFASALAGAFGLGAGLRAHKLLFALSATGVTLLAAAELLLEPGELALVGGFAVVDAFLAAAAVGAWFGR